MPFPEFDPEGKKLLFFSRGRGRGHAIPDVEIARCLEEQLPDIQIRFVCYDKGGETLAGLGIPYIDVGLARVSPLVEMTVLAGRLIRWLEPDIVVAHEEFAAIPAGKIFDKPVAAILDFFAAPEMYSMGTLRFADRVLFTGRRGVFEEPPWVRGRVTYIGPVVRRFQYTSGDKTRARRELGINEAARVISVFPGSWKEHDAPALDLILDALRSPEFLDVHLVWVAGDEAGPVRSRLASRQAYSVFDFVPEIDRLYAATDVAITKSNRLTVFELDHLGVATVALTYGANPVDEAAVAAVPGVQCLPATKTSPGQLADAIREVAAQAPRTRRMEDLQNALRCAAEIIAMFKEPIE